MHNSRNRRAASVHHGPRPSGRPIAAPPVIALPQLTEALRPLPQRSTLASSRPAGLAAQIAWWLQGRAHALSRLLASLSRADRPPPGHQAELDRLRQENTHLRAQLEALLALRPQSAMPDT